MVNRMLCSILATLCIVCSWSLGSEDAETSGPDAARPPVAARPSPAPPDPHAKPEGSLNLPIETSGGMQFWTDFVVRGGWRIQRHAMTGHYRLLDPKNVRQGLGNYAFCLQELDRRFPKDLQAADRGHVVVLLHGLTRSRTCWRPLVPRLEKEGYRVVTFGYASTRGSLSDHAMALEHMIRHLDECTTVSFVGHSLGNLVVRWHLGDHPEPLDGEPRRGRMVMLGPPNQGAEMARRLGDSSLLRFVVGPSWQQLGKRWNDAKPHLATPPFEFGVIAGGAGLPVSNPLIRGDDDLIVGVKETRLLGATDFRHIGAAHYYLPENDEAIELTVRFLRDGCFESPEKRQPIAGPD